MIRVLVDCLLNIICQLFIMMLLQQALLTISNFTTTLLPQPYQSTNTLVRVSRDVCATLLIVK